MRYHTFYEFFCHFLIVFLICVVILGIAMLLLFIKIKRRRLDNYSLIRFKQKCIVCVISALTWGILPVLVALIVWILSFFAYYIGFRNDAWRLESLYKQYDYRGQYPLISHINECKAVLKQPACKGKVAKDFRYHLMDYLPSMSLLLLLTALGVTSISRCSVMIYYIEFFTVATACFVLLCKVIYRISFSTPCSLFYLSTVPTSILLIIIGLVYYAVCFIIARSTAVGIGG